MIPLEDDPRLTAYALGELNSAERAEVEQLLTNNPAAREAAREIESVTQRLTKEFAADAAGTLGAVRTSEISGAFHKTRHSSDLCPANSTAAAAPKHIVLHYLRPFLSAAAAVIFAACGFWAATPAREQTGPRIEGESPIAAVPAKPEAAIESSAAPPLTLPSLAANVPTSKPVGTPNGDFDRLFATASEFGKKREFKVAASLMQRAMKSEPSNELAASLFEAYNQSAALYENAEVNGEYARQFQGALLDAEETKIPWRADILYPRNWGEIRSAAEARKSVSLAYVQPVGPPSRFEIAGQTGLSYGYTLPYGSSKSQENNLNIREVLKDESHYLANARVRRFASANGNTPVLGDIPTIGFDTASPLLDRPSIGLPLGSYVGPASPASADTEEVVPRHSYIPDFRNAPQIDIGNPDLPDSSLAAEEEIADRIKERERIQQQQRHEKIAQLFETAAQLRGEARIDEAEEAIRQVQYIDPNNSELPRWFEAVENDRYGPVIHNPFLTTAANPLSTFSIDVDTASYANVRRQLQYRRLPAAAMVRIEEFLNYFPYDYPPPADDAPFSAAIETSTCPWSPAHRLVRIGLRGWEPSENDRPTANLVFLIDVSGSMQPDEKLPLIVKSLHLLIDRLRGDDRIAIVTYAGQSGIALPSTPVSDRDTIFKVIDQLTANGSTNGGAGINLAYQSAADAFVDGGINRVILCTDGDFNVGVQDHDELQKLIETNAKSGVSLSVLGFGMGNYQDATLETLADRGDGNYAYIDTLAEAQKVLVDNLAGTLQTIAKDVKLQVEFNPRAVAGYRLLGYENRMLAAADFNDDAKDAGEIGAGHTVTAIYEVILAGLPVPFIETGDLRSHFQQPAEKQTRAADSDSPVDPFESAAALTLNDAVPPPPSPIDLAAETPENLAANTAIEPLKYQLPDQLLSNAMSGTDAPDELLTLKIRHKAPAGGESRLLEFTHDEQPATFAEASADFRFAAAVAGFAMHLRGTPLISDWNLQDIAETALTALGPDRDGRRAELVRLIEQARLLESQR